MTSLGRGRERATWHLRAKDAHDAGHLLAGEAYLRPRPHHNAN